MTEPTPASRLFAVLDGAPHVTEHLAHRLAADFLLDDPDTEDTALVAAAYARAWAKGDKYLTGEVLEEVDEMRPDVAAAIREALEQQGCQVVICPQCAAGYHWPATICRYMDGGTGQPHMPRWTADNSCKCGYAPLFPGLQ